MEFLNIYKDLVRETLLFKSFKGMSISKRILTFIVLFPFIAAYTALLLIYGAILVVYRLITDPFENLYQFVKLEGKDVKHATQAVVYFIAFPLIFLIKVLTIIITFALLIVHMLASMIGYIATFGGIKYSPFMLVPTDRLSKKDIVAHCKAATTTFIVIGMILLAMYLIFAPIANGICDIYKKQSIRSELLVEVKDAYHNNEITVAQYNSFAADYNDNLITSENYYEYELEYLGTVGEIWDEDAESDFRSFVASVEQVFSVAYVLFVAIFVSVYSNTRNKVDQPETEQPIVVEENM